MSEVNVKIGTVVNGITIESHKAMQAKIAELLVENDKLKEQAKTESDKAAQAVYKQYQAQKDTIPDWIVPGKWVENTVNNNVLKVKYVDSEWITFYPYKGESAVRVAPLCHHIKYKPFTPPPCPELPGSWRWNTDDILEVFDQGYSLDGAIALLQVDVARGMWSQSSLDRLMEIRDWREKWGEG